MSNNITHPKFENYVKKLSLSYTSRDIEALAKLLTELHSDWQDYCIQLLSEKVELLEELQKLKQTT